MQENNPERRKLLIEQGFGSLSTGAHDARTMMLSDLRALIACIRGNPSLEDFRHAVIEENCLSKPTKVTRRLTFRHLCSLYSLDVSNPLFRMLLKLWPLDEAAQPLLALTVAVARDALLRSSMNLVLDLQREACVVRSDFEALLLRQAAGRYSPASIRSFAQNLAGSWTEAGFLRGRVRKQRVAPVVAPVNVVLALFLGHLEGRSGNRLFSSDWTRLLDLPSAELQRMAQIAAQHDLLVFRHAGGVIEVRFPDSLSATEAATQRELAHVQ